MKLWKPRTFVPANPLTPIIQAKAKNFPKNVLFIWGADSYLDNAKGDMLQEFFEQDERKTFCTTNTELFELFGFLKLLSTPTPSG